MRKSAASCGFTFKGHPLPWDGVVVVTGDDRLRGGDATFAYFGTLTHADNGFTAELETKRHAQDRASVFNMEPVHIHLTGRSEGQTRSARGRQWKFLD
jgi:hypothetical protein